MTTTTIEPDVDVVDLSDIDLLDDSHRHARCVRCEGPGELGVPFIGICGRRAVTLAWIDPFTVPPDACPKCVEIFNTGVCPRCGAP